MFNLLEKNCCIIPYTLPNRKHENITNMTQELIKIWDVKIRIAECLI